VPGLLAPSTMDQGMISMPSEEGTTLPFFKKARIETGSTHLSLSSRGLGLAL